MIKLTFEELRRIKHELPSGSMKRIAESLDIKEDEVRTCFSGGIHLNGNSASGIHREPGPEGRFIAIEDSRIIEIARQILLETP